MSLGEEDTESPKASDYLANTSFAVGDPELRFYVAFQDDVFNRYKLVCFFSKLGAKRTRISQLPLVFFNTCQIIFCCLQVI